jgi:hypothetical protein
LAAWLKNAAFSVVACGKGEDFDFVALCYVAATANVVRKVICERGATFG